MMASVSHENEDLFEVVISGISGAFPESKDVSEFRENLFNKINMVSTENIRWNAGLWKNIPNATGKVKNYLQLDATFFGLLRPLADTMDPLVRITMEKVYEAIVDAGVNPSSLYGKDTFVYACSSNSEAESCTTCTIHSIRSYLWLMTHAHCYLANRISNLLNLHGSSVTTFSSFTGGLDILKLAADDIKKGRAKNALVIVSNVVQYPEVMRSHNSLGMLSPNGDTKPFDEDADGYGRSDGAVVLFLQRAEDARRIYGRIAHINVSQGNDVPRNILSVKPESFKAFLSEFYTSCKVPPSEVSFYEAYGCGVPVIDEVELNVVTEFFCKNRKSRLKIGSVKSNTGHTEAASSFISIIKALIALDSGFIPPNINYHTPNSKIPGLTDGRLEVVTEKDALDGDYIAVNCFNLFGGIGHILLKRSNPKETVSKLPSSIPRLILFSARHDLGVAEVMTKIESGPMSSDYHDLVQAVFSKNISGHFYRGYTILPIEEPSPIHGSLEMISENRSVWFICTGMGCQWTSMASELMSFPVFTKSLQECAKIMTPFGVDLIDVITRNDKTIFENIINCFIGITAIQIGLVDLLLALGIVYDGIIGHSLGETCCAYADGCFTKEQAMMCSYFRGKSSIDAPVSNGLMVAVGANYKELRDLPPTVVVGCRNSSTSCTLSGLAEDVTLYCNKLKERNIFHKIVSTGNRAYHSQYIVEAGKQFKQDFQRFVPYPKKRSSKWISSSIPEELWSTELASYSSAEYHYNNFVNTVLFDAACSHIPENAVVIEIAPHGLLQSILTRELPASCIHIPLMKREAGNQVKFLLSAIGKLYTAGLEVQLDALYPPPKFPISSCVPSLVPLMTWNHSDEWSISEFTGDEPRTITIDLKSSKFKFLLHHQIEGKIILPAAFLLVKLMEDLCKLQKVDLSSSAILAEDLIFEKHLTLDINDNLEIIVQRSVANGNFEFFHESGTLLSGFMNVLPLDNNRKTSEDNWYENNMSRFSQLSCQNSTNVRFDKMDLVALFESVGIQISSPFDLVERLILNEDECLVSVRWTNNIVAFLDAILNVQVALDIILNTDFVPLLPNSCHNLTVNFAVFSNIPEDSVIPVFVDLKLRCIQTKGLNLSGLQTSPVSLKENPKLEVKTLKLTQNINPPFMNLQQFLDLCLQLIIEIVSANWVHSGTYISVLESGGKFMGSQVSQQFRLVCNSQSDVCVDFQLVDGFKHFPSVFNHNSVIIDIEGGFRIDFNRCYDGFYLTSVPKHEDLLVDASTALLSEFAFENRRYVLLRKVPFSEAMRVIKMDKIYFQVSVQEYAINVDGVLVFVWEKLENIDPLRIFLQVKKSSIPKEFIRLVFILDPDARSFSLDDPFYHQRLKCGLVVNILKNGQWGGLNHMSVPEQDCCPQKNLLSLPLEDSFERFNVQLSHISVNLKDLTIDLNTEREVAVHYIDYVGLDPEKKRIIGLAHFDDDSSSLQFDPTLKWFAPESWSDEEVATIPYLYSLAYYMLGILPASDIKNKPVLIHGGSSAVGLASISVALELGAIVLTTVESSEKALIVSKQFLQSKNLHILLLDEILDLNVRCLTRRFGGIFVAINPFCGNLLTTSLNLLSHWGCCIQLGNLEMKNKIKLGMNVFLKAVSLYGFADVDLLNCPAQLKNEIHSFIAEKLRTLSLKPLPKSVFNCDDKTGLFNFLMKESQGNKAVVSVLNFKEKEVQTHPIQTTFLVIASKESMWLQLVSWLLKNSAKKIIIALCGNSANKALEHQLFQLMHKYNKVSFLLLLDSEIDTIHGTQNMMKAAGNLGTLNVILCLSLDKAKLRNIDLVSRQMGLSHSYFISLLNDSEELCHLRTLDCYPSLNVELKGHSRNLKYILLYLKSIISSIALKQDVFPASTISLHQCQSQKPKTGNFNLLLPTTVRDLIDLSGELSQCCVFEEVMTRSCPYKFTKECNPIFFIPGYSCKSLKSIFKRLMYPAFCATPTFYFESAETTALDLFQSLKRIKPEGSYTIVAETWSNCVALELSHLLENNGDIVKIILLNGSPESVKQHLLSCKKEFPSLSQSVSLPILLLRLEEMDLNTLAKRALATSTNGFSNKDKERIKCSLVSIQTKLMAAQCYKMRSQKFKGDVIIVKQRSSSSGVCMELLQNLNENQYVYFSAAESYECLVNDPEVATLINENATMDWM
nr:PREDICTED: fatty acid synthase-like [Bemisia tabaci]